MKLRSGTSLGLNIQASKDGLGVGLRGVQRIYHWDEDAVNYLARLDKIVTVSGKVRRAVNDFVVAAKKSNFWQTQDLIYPIIGGTAAAHALNMKSSSYTITWSGNLVHNNLGVRGVSGGSGAGSTGWNCSTNGVNFTRNDAVLGCYQTESISSVVFTAGAVNGALTGSSLAATYGGSNALSYVNALVGSLNTSTNTRGGWVMGFRNNSANTQIYINGRLGGSVSAASQSLVNNTMYIMCRNAGTAATPSLGGYCVSTVSFWHFGGSRFDINATNLAIQKLQQALSRNIFN